MSSIDVNDLKKRIDLLYHITDGYVERTPVAPISVEKKINIDTEGKETISVSFGGGKMTSEEERRAISTILELISKLANLKDHLKIKLKQAGKNKKTVEEAINSSPHLCTIIDLNNSEKHGYPTQTRRSGHDPRIDNIRKELGIPLIPGRFTNMFSSGVVTFEADVVNKSGKKVYDFRELIEKSLSAWEDFCIVNLPSESHEIISRRDKLKRENEWRIDHASRGKEVEKIISNPENWHEILGQHVINGMIVKATGFEEKAATLMGFPTESPEITAAKDYVKILDVVFGNQVNLGKKSNKWELLVVDTQAKLKLVNDYYWELFHPPDFS